MRNLIHLIIIYSSFILFIVNISTSTNVFSMDLNISASGGYDSNIAQNDEKNSSFFSEYQIKSNFEKKLNNLDIETNLSISANYRDYVSYDNNLLLRSDLVFSRDFPKFIKGEFFVTSYLYRDDFIYEDERNTFGTGASLTFYGLSNWEFYIDTEYFFSGYINEVLPNSGSPRKSFSLAKPICASQKNSHFDGDDNTNGKGKNAQEPHDRNDDIIKTRAGFVNFFSKHINFEFSIDYERLVSEIDLESYFSVGINTEIIWMPANNSKFDLVSRISDYYYDKFLNSDDNRKDQLYNLNLRASYFFNKMELYAFYDYQMNNSQLNEEDFIQSVTACGISYSF